MVEPDFLTGLTLRCRRQRPDPFGQSTCSIGCDVWDVFVFAGNCELRVRVLTLMSSSLKDQVRGNFAEGKRTFEDVVVVGWS